MLHDVKDYFYFTKNEKKGILVLSVLIILSFFIPRAYDVISKPAEDAEIEGLINSGICVIPYQAVADSDSIRSNLYYNHTYSNKYADKEYSYPGSKSLNVKTIPVIEINTADSLDLLSLPGIGPYFAKAIIRYRERLGGYNSVKQLLEIWGMDAEKLKRLSPNLKVDTNGLKKIGVNTAEFKALMRHPYSNYQIAKALILFRKQFGQITQMEDLRKSGVIPDTSYTKLLPYLSLE